MRSSRFVAATLISVAAAVINGCATMGKAVQPPVPDPKTATSIVSYANQLSHAIMTPGIELWNHIIPIHPRPESTPDARTSYDITWGDLAKTMPIQEVRDNFGIVCANRSGIWGYPFCRAPNDPDVVYFYASADPHHGDVKYNEIGFQSYVIEPLPGHETSPGYINLLRQKAGYMTRQNVATVQAQQLRQQEIAQADAAQAVAEQPMVRTIGSKICRIENRWLYTGYVEQVVGEKIQIRIDNVSTVKDSGLHPGNFSGQYIIWDSPERWRLCH